MVRHPIDGRLTHFGRTFFFGRIYTHRSLYVYMRERFSVWEVDRFGAVKPSTTPNSPLTDSFWPLRSCALVQRSFFNRLILFFYFYFFTPYSHLYTFIIRKLFGLFINFTSFLSSSSFFSNSLDKNFIRRCEWHIPLFC